MTTILIATLHLNFIHNSTCQPQPAIKVSLHYIINSFEKLFYLWHFINCYFKRMALMFPGVLSNLYGLLSMVARDTGLCSLSPRFLLMVNNLVQPGAEREIALIPRHPPPVRSLQKSTTCSLFVQLSQRIYF